MPRIVNRVRKSSKRDNEVVVGWDKYYKIALKQAWKWLRYYFPSREDLEQSAALAATIAQVRFGEEATLNELTRVINKVLKEEAKNNGRRQRKVRLPDGRITMIEFQAYLPFAELTDHLQEESASFEEVQEWYETRMMFVGVGEWTRRQSTQLNF
ncbi:MAG: hypothetical protein J0I20_29415 [Chloroflexi bacterium]|jgi:hypothetical protein|nr:hypothetical protein [Chloroflexota bacterium]OJV95044.1 MAG: hypothetical protein BGO39_28700 [Chloroflexi bacterium 54-19]